MKTKNTVRAVGYCGLLVTMLTVTIWAPSAGAVSKSKTPVSEAQVLESVQAAQSVQQVPSNLRPPLTNTTDNAEPGKAESLGRTKCHGALQNPAMVPNADFGYCDYGDPKSSKLMIVYGDSHAGMWAAGLQTVAARAGWKMEIYSLPGCPSPDLSFISYTTNDPNAQCTKFHQLAPIAIKSKHPQIVVVTSQSSQQVSRGVFATSAQWQSGLEAAFTGLAEPGTSIVMIGDIPEWANDVANCLALHESSVQTCASPQSTSLSSNLKAEETASAATGVHYISTTSWVCGPLCEPVIHGIRTYINEYHLSDTYVQYLSGALQTAMGIPSA